MSGGSEAPRSRSSILQIPASVSRSILVKGLFLFWISGGANAQTFGSDRSLALAVQNINGASSVLSLLPVLTGKTHNVKMIASRIFPGALIVTGVGTGRVLSKLQIGVLLLSSNLYRNVVSDFTYHHDEYVNNFSPALIHIPTGTPERHSSNIIINHNPTEIYMVEAWFRTQGRPAKVELHQGNNKRVFVGMVIYTIIYAFETYLGMRNAATGTGLVLMGLHLASGIFWVVAVCLLQVNRGQGKQFINLNRLDTPEYRCFKLVVLGQNVESAVLSTHLDNIREYRLFGSEYENNTLKSIGGLMLASAIIDVFATILLVGFTSWAYAWLGYQVLLTFVKLGFSLEPLRETPVKNIQAMDTGASPSQHGSQPEIRLPLHVNCAPEFTFIAVCTEKNVILENDTKLEWHSRSPGLYIGQPYHHISEKLAEEGISTPTDVRYLALSGNQLVLVKEKPAAEQNQALQREFLACLGEVVKANHVASQEFVSAVESTVSGIRKTMDADWYAFGSKDLLEALNQCKANASWRRII